MKVFIYSLCLLLVITSCHTAKEVNMPFRNYYIGAERLFPLLQSDEQQSIRIWSSQSTSIDRVIVISKMMDSSIMTKTVSPSFSGWLIEYGDKMRPNKKFSPYYKKIKIEPTSGFVSFFKILDSLNLADYKDQHDVELTNHQPLSLCVIEYLNKGQYSRFYFRPSLSANDTIQEPYAKIEQWLQNEFGTRKNDE